METRIFLVTLSFIAVFLSANAAPVHTEMPEDIPLERECLYQTQYYSHGTSIETEEPCLNCTCNKGVLVCFLRVCHNLVAPQDSDCEVRKSEGQCCAELVCGVKNLSGIVGNATQSADVTTITPRLSDLPLGSTAWWTSSEGAPEDTTLSPTDFTVSDNAVKSGCGHNGSIYAEGSAMPSSAFCEYCYCIKGHQRCIRPQCHLHIDECKPIYRHDFSCCPTAYKCSKRISDFTSTSTTTAASVRVRKRQDCHINGTTHKEGDVVYSEDVCQNCFCVKGEVRCSTITCALNMEGCQPIIQPGKCCPTGYNCTIPTTTEAGQEQDFNLTGSTTVSTLQQSEITSYFDNAISSTDSSISEFQDAAYESRTSMDTLFINDTDAGNETIATRNNDRNILEADASVATTLADEDTSSQASEIISSTPESTGNNELGETTVGDNEISSLAPESSGKHNLEATTDLPAETEDSSSYSPATEETLSASNVTEDISKERTYAADAVDTNTTLSKTVQSLNKSADDADGFSNDNILQSKAAVTDSIQPEVNESLSKAEINSTDEYAFKNATEATESLADVKSHISSVTVVNATESGNTTILLDAAFDSSDHQNSSGNTTVKASIDPTSANETNNDFEQRSESNNLTTESAVVAEDEIQNVNSSKLNNNETITNLNDSISNNSVIERTDIDDNITQTKELEERKSFVPNALFGGTHEASNTTVNISKDSYQHDQDSTASNNSVTNSTASVEDIFEVETNTSDEYTNNRTAYFEYDSKNASETTPLPHNLQFSVPFGKYPGSNLTIFTAEENKTSINESLTSENVTESLNDTTHLNLIYKTPQDITVNSTSSPTSDAEQSNITTIQVDKVANEAIYRQVVKGSSNISSFEDESIPIVHLSSFTTDKTTPADVLTPKDSLGVSEVPSDQLRDPYVAEASNETLVFKPGPTPSNGKHALLGSFSSIVSSLLKEEDNGSITTEQSVRDSELVHPNLPESFDVLLEDLVGEFPGEVQFNTISYLNLNNDVTTVSTTTVSQDNITHSAEQEAKHSNETQLVGKGEAATVLNGSTEAPNQFLERSDVLINNITDEDQQTVEKPDEKNETRSTGQVSKLPFSEGKHTTDTAENQTKSPLLDTTSGTKVDENEIQTKDYNQSTFEATTSGDVSDTTSNSEYESPSCNNTNNCNTTDISPTLSQPNQTFDKSQDNEAINVTKSANSDDLTILESTTEKELQAFTTQDALNFTFESDSNDGDSVKNISNVSDIQPLVSITTLKPSTHQEISTQQTINNTEEISFNNITEPQVSYSNSPTLLQLNNETLQSTNDSFIQDLLTTASPLQTEASDAIVLHASTTPQTVPLTTVESQNKFHYHDNNFEAGIETAQEAHNITAISETTPETSTIVEDLDDTLEMILNLSKTYALTHPRPSLVNPLNKTEEELLSGTLPSEVEAKIAEIIRQAQAGLIHGGAPSLHRNHTIPHFVHGEYDSGNTTVDDNRNHTGTSDLSSSSNDYEYDAVNDSGESQSLVPDDLLAQIGGLFNSSWTSQISGDVHRDSFHKFPDVSKEPQSSPPTNESIMNDLHQMFIPLLNLTKKLNSTFAASTDSPSVTTLDSVHNFHDASTLLPRDASTTQSHVDIELTTLFPKEFIKEVNTHNETQSEEPVFFNGEKTGSSVFSVDDSHHQHAPTEASIHSIQEKPDTQTTEKAADAGDQWPDHGDGHFSHGTDDAYKEDAADSHHGLDGHSDIEDEFSHAVAADDDEKSYFSADDFETGPSRHEVENSGEVSAADSKLSADEINTREDLEHNDALLESTHLDGPSSIADWQDERDKPDHQLEYGNTQPELLESVPQIVTEALAIDTDPTTKEGSQHFTSTTSSSNQEVEALPIEETEAPATFLVEKSAVTEVNSEAHNTEALTEPTTTQASAEVLNEKTTTSETSNVQTTTQTFTTKAMHDFTNTEAFAEPEALDKDESSVDNSWLDLALADDSTKKPTETSIREHHTTTTRSIPRDPASNFFSTLSNFFSQAIANAGLQKQGNTQAENKAGTTDVSESAGSQQGFGSHYVGPAQNERHPETAIHDTKSEENPEFPETGFLRKDTEISGHHSLVTEAISIQNREPDQHHYTGSESQQHPSESSFNNPETQNHHQHHDPNSEEHAPEVFQSPFVASEVITTPDPNAFVGLVSKGSIVFENVLPLSRRGRPTTDERTGQALPTPRKSSSIDNESTEESALAPEDVRVIPFLPEDAITDELHKEPVKPNLAPRNEDKDAIPAAEELEPITRTPLAQDINSMTVRVSATSSFQADDAPRQEDNGSVGVAVPISPEGEEFVPLTDATQKTITSSAATTSSPEPQEVNVAITTSQPPSTVTEMRLIPSSTMQQTEFTSSTGVPVLSESVDEDADLHLEHHITEATHEATPRTQSTRTNKNDDQGVFNIQSGPNFQQTPDYCVEEGEVFQDGERIPTSDFCAQCRCNRGEIQCQHVSCPQRPPGCIEKVMPSSCCPAFLCNETGLIQDGDSGLPLRSGITIHGGFVPIERPLIPHEQHGSAFEDTQSHAEVPPVSEVHGPEHSMTHQGGEDINAGGHVFGGDVERHEATPVEQTVAPRTPEPPQNSYPITINEGLNRVSTTENSGIFSGLLESVFGGEETQSPSAQPGIEETVVEVKEPGPTPAVADIDTTGVHQEPDRDRTEIHEEPGIDRTGIHEEADIDRTGIHEESETDRTGIHEESDIPLTSSTSSSTSRRTTEASPPTEGTTSTKAQDGQAGLWPMLKVSSCNIYGRVYQVGSKIGVLSGPCKECKCTNGGVECYRIKCF